MAYRLSAIPMRSADAMGPLVAILPLGESG
jgi:hypothetical protein